MTLLNNPALIPFLPLIVLVVVLAIGFSLEGPGENQAVPPAPPPGQHDGH